MYRFAPILFACLLAACGGEAIEKSGDNASANGATSASTNNGGFPNGSANQSTGNNGATTGSNNLPDPMFENPCNSGPLDAPIPNCTPDALPSTGDPAEDCVRRINQFRWECQCLPPLERWTEGEQCAEEQAAYDRMNLQAHAGFSDNICSPRGSAQNECPDWNSWDQVLGNCLQQMWDEGPGEDFQAHGHYLNMSNTDFSRVACGASDGWFVQNFQ